MCCRGMIPRTKVEPGQQKERARGCSAPGNATQLWDSLWDTQAVPKERQFGMHWVAGGGRAGEAGGELAAAFPSPDPKGEHRTSGKGRHKIPQKALSTVGVDMTPAEPGLCFQLCHYHSWKESGNDWGENVS